MGICGLKYVSTLRLVVRCSALSSVGVLIHGDDDFSLGVSCFKIPQRFSSLRQWVASIDNRRNAPCLEQLLHERQILLRRVLHKGAEPLPMLLLSPRPQHHGFEKPTA